MTKKPLILAIETSSRIGSAAIAFGEKILAETTFPNTMRHSAEIFPTIQQLLNRFSLKSQEIEHVYISIGPGSFTGLRIATTFAKTMCLANAVKIVAVDTLDVIAANVNGLTSKNIANNSGHESSLLQPNALLQKQERCAAEDEQAMIYEKIAPIVDAKRNQFFTAVYQRTNDELQAVSDGIWKKILTDSLMTASQFIEKFSGSETPIWLLGDGLLYYKDKFKAEGIRFLDQKYWSPRAGKVYLLGRQKALAGQFADPVTLTPNYLLRPDAEEKWQLQKNI